MPLITFGSGRAIRSIVIGLLIIYAMRRGNARLAARLTSKL